MASPTRQEALATLREGQARLDELLWQVADDELTRQATIGDGDWSAKDLIGHIATWEELALRSLQEFRDRTVPWVEQPDGVFSAPATGKVDAFNAEAVAGTRAMSLAEVRDHAAAVHAELLEAIDGMADQEWTGKAFYPTPNNRRRRLSTLLGSVLGAPSGPFGHAFAHIPDLESFVAKART